MPSLVQGDVPKVGGNRLSNRRPERLSRNRDKRVPYHLRSCA